MNSIRFLVAIALIISATCEIDGATICKKSINDACIPFQTHFPENKEEFKQYCSILLSITSCQLDYSNRCSSFDEYDSSWKTKRYEKTLNTIHIFCDEESELHKAVAEHISCFKDVFQNFNIQCRNLTNELSNTVGYKNGVEDYDKFQCLKNVLHTSCMMPKIRESCGIDAEATFMDVFNAIKDELRGCPEQSVTEVAEMVQVLEMEEGMKHRAQRILELLQLREHIEYEY